MSDRNVFAEIRCRYLLISFIPYYEDAQGRVWLDRAWHHDLVQHMEYLFDLTLVAPKRSYRSDIADLVLFECRQMREVRFIGMRSQDSTLLAIKNLPSTILLLAQEIKRAEIVHSNIIGWPFPLGWIANPLALYMGRKLVLVVESAFWRRVPGSPKPSFIQNIRSSLTERLGRYFMQRADLAIATQPSYLESLRGSSSKGIGFVNPASWVNEDDILPVEALRRSWVSKRTVCTLRLLFAGRLTKEKGIGVLLDAVDMLDMHGIAVHIDIIGQGPMLAECQNSSKLARSSVLLTLLQPVTYGQEFFHLLSKYHAVLVPSLTDEQPRILFDAYSQGVPVVAANTDGIRPHVDDRVGWLVTSGSAESLSKTITTIVSQPWELENRGVTAHQLAGLKTHREMHRARSHELAKLDVSNQLG